ncbi:unnamed protein product [Somion occarium]|uniref:Uncharacterized protein n=1 Tax=Somion occarium TaxID=3059160 RepID=A0ABP1DM44_9APHY
MEVKESKRSRDERNRRCLLEGPRRTSSPGIKHSSTDACNIMHRSPFESAAWQRTRPKGVNPWSRHGSRSSSAKKR